MKCPKCGYLGFEEVDRCRNCGYEFSLIWPPKEPDLALRPEMTAALGALDDLPLTGAGASSSATSIGALDATPAPSARAGLSMTVEAPASGASWTGTVDTPGSVDLPLFELAPDDPPLIAAPIAPRAPLAVRRATPEVPRLKAETARAPMLDLEPTPSIGRRPMAEARADAIDEITAVGDAVAGPEPAGLVRRTAALLLDLLVVGAVDAVVIYFTMQVCGLDVRDLHILPKGPLLAFLLVQNGGYLVAFTVGGQTLGKMAAGIKVVAERADAPLDLGRSIIRTLIWVVLAVPAGLGFLSALFNHDHRGLHDRWAGTRVIRAT